MFAEYAPHYWAKGLPVIPLRPKMKVPWLNAWSQYSAQMPTEDEQARWMAAYPDGNIGLPLGPQSGIVGLDLDSEDPRVLSILQRLMPATPWRRIGKKGAVFGFRYNGERTYRIKDEENKTILELLSRGAQIVLPPSIHPDTQRPYEASGHLYEMLDQLPGLPLDFEDRIRSALIEAGFKLTSRGALKVAEWVPAGGRDSQMVAQAGILARAVLRGERTVLEACNEIETWIASYTERVTGDNLDPSKGRAKVMEFIRRDVTENGKILPPSWLNGMTAEEIAQAREYLGDDVEEWTVNETLEFIQTKFGEIPKEDQQGRIAVVDQVLLQVARSEKLSSLEKEQILNFIQMASGKMVTLAALRRRVKELMGEELVGNDHSEIANALITELEREGEVRFHQSKLYQWFGSHWRELPDEKPIGIISDLFGHLPAAKKFSDYKGITSLMQKLKAKELCTHEVPGINFANGYLTNDMELLTHAPTFGATYCLPYRYVPDERAPSMWMSFLDQCWGFEPDFLERVQSLREAIAATLFGVAWRYQRAFCLYGIPHSGKSTMLDIVKGLIPADAASNIPPEEWGDKFMPTLMAKSLINFCGDMTESQLINGSRFKQIVEGTEMAGQYKGKDIFNFRPRCAHWFGSNHLPRTRDSSLGFVRRWLVFSFTRAVTTSQKREGLAEEILGEEREAIVAWAVPAIRDLMRKQDYTLPPSHVAVVGEIANLNNSVRHFLTSRHVELDGAGEVDENELYLAYNAFCRITANCTPMQLKRFRMVAWELKQELGFDLRMGENDVGTYTGLALKKQGAKAKAA